MEIYRERLQQWLDSDAVSDAEKEELRELMGNEELLKERFLTYLSFGTAGLRGTMNAGTNAMNVHTVRHATQGLARYILASCGAAGAQRGVVIAYDSRNRSELFAHEAARVLAANGISVSLFGELRPTPELSFAVRNLHCIAGINITASHNPKQYNGYKAYWEDGAQLSPEQADAVSAEIKQTDIFRDVKLCDFDRAVAEGKIKILNMDYDEAYLTQVLQQRVYPQVIEQVADTLSIVYTPLHGAGYRLVPEVLHRAGFRRIFTVPEQEKPDGDFPTVKNPNPEFPEVFAPGIRLAQEKGSDLIIATDPDADRTGIMVRTGKETFEIISGNQIGALLLDYIISALEETKTMPPEPYVVKSIVSSELATKICEAHGITIHNVLTGFKFIGEVIKQYEEAGHGTFLFGFEESHGYLKGTYARDKDAVVTSMLLAEMAAYYKVKGITLYDALQALTTKYGCFQEATDDVYMTGLYGQAQMEKIMEDLRAEPPASIGGEQVVEVRDYRAQTITDLKTGKTTGTGLPKSNVMYFVTETGNVVVFRPSGTEPKLKIYYLMRGEDNAAIEAQIERCRRQLHDMPDMAE